MTEKKPEHMQYRKQNLIVLGFLIVMFVAFLVMTSSLGATSSRMPRVACYLGLILCAVEAYQQIKHLKDEKADAEEHFDKVNGKPAWLVLLAMIVYIPLLNILGFFLASLIFLFILPYLLGRKKILGNLIYSVISTVLLWGCFIKIFNLRLPSGLIFEMFL